MLVAMAGAFSLSRLDSRFDQLGFLGEPRIMIGALLFAAGLLFFLARGGEMRAKRREWLWYFAFFSLHVFVAASYLWSYEPWMGVEQLQDLALLVLFVLVFSQLFGAHPEDSIEVMFGSCILLSMPFLALSLVLFASGASEAISAGFSSGAGGIGMSRLFGLASIAVVYHYMRSGKMFALVLLPLYAAGIMVSGSRAAMLSLVVAFAFLLWRRKFVGARENRRWLPRVLLAFVAILGLGAFFMTPFGFAILEGFVLSNIVSNSASPDAGGIYLADRDVIFQHALSEFLANPLTGLGIGTYRGPFGEPYPHNLVLLYGTDAGILGVLVLLGFIAAFSWQALRSRSDWTVAASTAGVFLLVASLFAGSYYDARVFWFMSLALTIRGLAETGNTSVPQHVRLVPERT